MVYAGVDVGKGWLDLALLSLDGQEGGAGKGGATGKQRLKKSGESEKLMGSKDSESLNRSRKKSKKSDVIEHYRFNNDPPGRESLIKLLLTKRPRQVVLEASGVYHLPLLTLLLKADVAAFLANPYQVAAFRKAWGGQEQDRQPGRRAAGSFCQGLRGEAGTSPSTSCRACLPQAAAGLPGAANQTRNDDQRFHRGG